VVRLAGCKVLYSTHFTLLTLLPIVEIKTTQKTDCLLWDSWCGKSGCCPRECGHRALLWFCSSPFVHWHTFYARHDTTLCTEVLHSLCLQDDSMYSAYTQTVHSRKPGLASRRPNYL